MKDKDMMLEAYRRVNEMNEVNLNDTVKVRLTEEGIQVLARQHNELRKKMLTKGWKDSGEFVLRLDSEGYYTTQLWTLINKFSDNIDLGEEPMFVGGNLYFPGENKRS